MLGLGFPELFVIAVIIIIIIGAILTLRAFFSKINKKQTLKQKLDELSALHKSGGLSDDEYQKVRQNTIDSFGKES
jgi:biopolymer transport protein ExbB/TolQ